MSATSSGRWRSTAGWATPRADPLPSTGALEEARAYGLDAPFQRRGAEIAIPGGDRHRLQLVQWLDPYDDEPPYPPPINHIGIDRIALAVTDLHLAVSTLREEGAEFLSEIAPCCSGTGADETGIINLLDPDGIYKRFDRHGVYDEAGRDAQTAHRVRKLIGPTPVLLLTAPPLQNSLAELWGLLHYIEPPGTLLESFPTFKTLFCEKTDGRRLVPEQGAELKRRLGVVVQRTLRRQAQDFLDKPFVGRQAKLYEYSMSPEERKLYDDVTSYLLVEAANLRDCRFFRASSQRR